MLVDIDNYEGFFEKFAHQMSLNRGRMTAT